MRTPRPTSRITGFYRRSLPDRLRTVLELGQLSDTAIQLLQDGGGLSTEVADCMSENVIATHGLPLSVALNFRVNQRDYLVPMAVEEPSVVAAASNAARLLRISGGFVGQADPGIMTAQVQLDDVPDVDAAIETVVSERSTLMAIADRAIPGVVRRGGGCRDIDARVLDHEAGVMVVHLYVDVCDAMGANTVDTVAEAVAGTIHELSGGTLGLRILSNLPLRRMVRVSARVSEETLGAELCRGISNASRFAELDVMRATTHNKGVMNGIDAVAVALGQDWRAIEAGAHGFAAISGRYRPIATWHHSDGVLTGRIELPLAVGTVGGCRRLHPGVKTAFEILQVENAAELATVMAAAGLASNLAALKALAGEGIQQGHMRLHRKREHAPPKTQPSCPPSQAKPL